MRRQENILETDRLEKGVSMWRGRRLDKTNVKMKAHNQRINRGNTKDRNNTEKEQKKMSYRREKQIFGLKYEKSVEKVM